MGTLTVPTVQSTNGSTLSAATNEADDIREKLKLKQLRIKEQEANPLILNAQTVDTHTIEGDRDSADESGSSEYETASSSEEDSDDVRSRRKRKIVFLSKAQREAHLEKASKPSLEEEAELLEAMEEERQQTIRQHTSEKVRCPIHFKMYFLFVMFIGGSSVEGTWSLHSSL